MKLYDRPKTQETLDRLPELPEEVQVPDDISGLQPPTTRRATGGAIRWMRWLAAIVVFGAVGVMAAVIFSGGTTEIDQADVYGSDLHLTTWEDLATNRNMDYMAVHGTDNPVFVISPDVVVDRAQLEAAGYDRHLATWQDLAANRATDYMELYGTDNPVFVPAVVVEPGLYMELFGTDNPVFVQPADTDFMEIYGTDNPVLVEGSDHPYADFFG